MAETKVPSIPPVPSGADSAERQFLGAVKETIEVREGRRGDPLDMAVTLRRLQAMGAITLDQFGNPVFTGGGNTTITVPGGGGGSGGYVPDITPPPMPSGLTATAGFAMIFVEWDSPAYTQGHGNAYTEIWAANRPAGGPDPTFGAAVFVGSTAGTGGFFSDSVPTLGVQRHYWIRHVTNDGVAGAYAGGTNGVSAATGKVGGVDLAPLIIDASKLADGAVDFGGSKVTGTITDPARFGAAVIGSAAIANLAVQNQHVASLSADKITFGSMSGDRISVNTINADKFVANLFQTDNVLTRGLTVRDNAGNVILAAGVPLNFANVTPSSGWLNDNIRTGGANLVGNSSFRKHNGILPDGWAVYNNGGTAASHSIINGAGPFGEPYCRIIANQATTQTLGIYTGTGTGDQGPAWEAGRTYIVSVWSFANNAAAAGFGLYPLYSNMGFTSIEVIENPPMAAEWRRHIFRVVPASNASTAAREIFISWSGALLPAGADFGIACVQVELGTQPSGWKPGARDTLNSNVTISSSGTLLGAGGGQVTIGGLGYTGDLNATYGASIGVNLSGAWAQATWDAAMPAAYIRSAHIAGLTVDKLLAGAMAVGQYIQSTNYSPGVSGWRINADGTAEFGPTMIRGKLTVAQVDYAGSVIDNGSITITGGQIGGIGTGSGGFVSNNYTEGNILHVMRPVGGAYGATSPVTGVLKIALPQSWTNTMLRFSVEIFEYNTNSSTTFEIGGYNYAAGSSWYNTFARMTGPPGSLKPVRFGHDGVSCCIWIGETNTSWQYPQVRVTNLVAGYSNYAENQWATGWGVSISTAPYANVSAVVASPVIGGAFSGLDIVTSSNVGTYFANAAIGAAQIGSIALVGTANFNVKTATSGARQELDSRAIKIYDSAGTLRVRIGDLTA